MKYWEKEFTVDTQKEYRFRFKKMSPIDILAVSNEVEMYAGAKDTEMYKKFLDDALSNTEVQINGAWVPVKEGNNYLPASIAEDYNGLRQISLSFFDEVIKPVFMKSGE